MSGAGAGTAHIFGTKCTQANRHYLPKADCQRNCEPCPPSLIQAIEGVPLPLTHCRRLVAAALTTPAGFCMDVRVRNPNPSPFSPGGHSRTAQLRFTDITVGFHSTILEYE